MNTLIQNILVLTALAIALGFIIKKFFLKKANSNNDCGKDDCGCH